MKNNTRRPRRAVASGSLLAHVTVLALSPAHLHAQAEAAVHDIYRQSESANTVRAYAAALRYWAGWFQLRYRERLALPVPAPVVVQFIVDHVERHTEAGTLVHDLPPAIDAALLAAGFKAKPGAPKLPSVEQRLAVLSKAHQLRELANPLRDPQVQELMKRVRRAYASRGAVSQPKRALTAEPLAVMLATCGEDLAGRRDRALLLLSWSSGGRRRSEVTRVRVEDLERLDAGTFVFRLGQTKTQQAGTAHDPTAAKPLVGQAAHALIAWLSAAQITTGPLFRRIRGCVVGEPLTPQAVRNVVRDRARRAGLDPDLYAAHSLRSGFMTEAGRRGVPLKEAMALTGHKSLAQALQYFQVGNATQVDATTWLTPDMEPAP
jgi:integrase